MTSKNPVGYCPYCKMKVSLKREGINIPLAILLGIFTGGIGLLIYLAIYYNRAEDRCINCRNRIFPLQTPVNSSTYQTQSKLTATTGKVEEVRGEKLFYCSFCGEKLDERNLEFCPNCGGKVELK
jgi:hypothetical protein